MATSHGFFAEVRIFFLDLFCDWSKLFGMDTPHDKYRRQISDAWSELISWEKLLGMVEQRVADLRELIRATSNLLPDNERANELALLDIIKHPANITEATRSVLFIAAATGTRLTPTEIKQRAEQRGFSFTEYTNPLASIHTILRRMKESTPPEVDYKEDDGTYLFVGVPGELSPEFLQRTRHETWQRIVDRAVDPELTKTLMAEVTREVVGEAIDSTRKRLRK